MADKPALNTEGETPLLVSDNDIQKLIDQLSPEEKLFASEIRALTLEGSLVRKDYITARMFLMANGTTMLALVFSELKDSFIIGLPAIISVNDSNQVRVKMVASSAIVKLFKHTAAIVMMPEPRMYLYYLTSIRSMVDKIPGYFNKERIAQVGMLIAALQNALDISENKETLKPSPEGVDKESVDPTFSNTNPVSIMSHEDDAPPSRTGRPTRYKH